MTTFNKVSNVKQVNTENEKNSSKLLKSLIQEFRETKYPFTHVGVIAEVRKTVVNDTNVRVFVISYSDGYVYMLENQAPQELQNLAEEEIIGTELPFKVFFVGEDNDGIYVSYSYVTTMYAVAYQKNDKLHGKIVGSKYDSEGKNSYFTVDAYGDKLYMKISDFSAYGTPKYLPTFHNQAVNFKIVGVDEENRIWVSKKAVEAEYRDTIIKELKEAKDGVIAEITKINDSGAYINYKGVLMILRNIDFSTDYTPISMVKKKGDAIRVKVSYISPSKRIHVEPVEKFTTPASENMNKFQKGETVTGTVINKTSYGMFVRIDGGDGADVLCPIPFNLREPERNEKIRVKITNVYERNRRDGSVGLGLKGVMVSFADQENNFKPSKIEKESE